METVQMVAVAGTWGAPLAMPGEGWCAAWRMASKAEEDVHHAASAWASPP